MGGVGGGERGGATIKTGDQTPTAYFRAFYYSECPWENRTMQMTTMVRSRIGTMK